jgi:hypothetical protein
VPDQVQPPFAPIRGASSPAIPVSDLSILPPIPTLQQPFSCQ